MIAATVSGSPWLAAVPAGAVAGPPPCVPRSAEVLAASRTTAVYERGRRVLACTSGRPPRTLVTQTGGRRLDAVTVRGDRVAFAGQVSSENAFGGEEISNVTRVLTLAGGTLFARQNHETVSSLRLTPAGTAIGTERHGRLTALFAASPHGRVLLDLRRALRDVRVAREVVSWSADGRRRGHDVSRPTGQVVLVGPIPNGFEPLRGSFTATVAGAYQISVLRAAAEGRYETCPGAWGDVRVVAPSQDIAFEVTPSYAEWCQYDALEATLELSFGGDVGDARYVPNCVDRPTPCGGRLEIARTQLPADSSR